MNIRKALLEAIDQSSLAPRDKFRLRLATRFPRYMDRITPDIEGMLAAEGMHAEGPMEAIDWAKLIKFCIENILPLLLDLLDS